VDKTLQTEKNPKDFNRLLKKVQMLGSPRRPTEVYLNVHRKERRRGQQRPEGVPLRQMDLFQQSLEATFLGICR